MKKCSLNPTQLEDTAAESSVWHQLCQQRTSKLEEDRTKRQNSLNCILHVKAKPRNCSLPEVPPGEGDHENLLEGIFGLLFHACQYIVEEDGGSAGKAGRGWRAECVAGSRDLAVIYPLLDEGPPRSRLRSRAAAICRAPAQELTSSLRFCSGRHLGPSSTPAQEPVDILPGKVYLPLCHCVEKFARTYSETEWLRQSTAGWRTPCVDGQRKLVKVAL
ncbi:uncharacterized protein LOC133341194 [Lethenteron reissneri]|uniref:uncharacterized protein LOC133341194 n=1 Tax=Lethenteron reissneri TaxID=7753 RepID=UPI002AB60E0F|nr:uncharacterized protein LOC133341194 [Lethenteron reissneri]